MCEMCFAVLDAFNKKQGYKNNEDAAKAFNVFNVVFEPYNNCFSIGTIFDLKTMAYTLNNRE